MLGKGSTSRALLVTKDEQQVQRVFKVALNDAAARRLEREAAAARPSSTTRTWPACSTRRSRRGRPTHRRKIIGVEYIGGHTLAEELRQHGPLTIHELERLGEDLFQALTFLDRRGVWHRDIKPDNLALRELERKGRELVLFDFSLAGTPDTDLGVGTKDYLDPFLGPADGTRYDQAAELYAVAVTLHEMASGELPSWGDDLAEPGFLDPDEEVQLAEDLFDPVARDGLVEFFKAALHRDAAKRFGSLREMTRAWTDIFRDLETVPPLTTVVHRRTGTTQTDSRPRAEREAASGPSAPRQCARRRPRTPLAAAGLSAARPVDRASSASASPPPATWPASPPAASPGCAASAAAPATSWSACPGSGGSDSTSPRLAAPGGRQWLARTEATILPDGRGLSPERAEAPLLQPRRNAGRPRSAVRRRGSAPPRPGVARAAPGHRPRSPATTAARCRRGRASRRLPAYRHARAADVAAHLERLRARWQKSVPALAAGPRRPGGDPRRARPHPRLAAARRRPAGPARFRARRPRRAACGSPRSASAPPSRPKSAATIARMVVRRLATRAATVRSTPASWSR